MPARRSAIIAPGYPNMRELSACPRGASTSTLRNVNTAKTATKPIRKITKVGVSVRSVPSPGGAIRRGPSDPASVERGQDRDEATEGHGDAAGEVGKRDPMRADVARSTSVASRSTHDAGPYAVRWCIGSVTAFILSSSSSTAFSVPAHRPPRSMKAAYRRAPRPYRSCEEAALGTALGMSSWHTSSTKLRTACRSRDRYTEPPPGSCRS